MQSYWGGVSVDMILTDPPYNVAYTGKTKDALTIENDKMTESNFRDFLLSVFRMMKERLKAGRAFYIWYSTSETLNFVSALQDAGLEVRQILVWNKNSFTLGRQDYQWKHEPCLYGWKEGAPHYFVDDRTQSTVIDCDKPSRSEEHPTMKPISLLSRLINNSSRKGEIVFDPFGGSGSTLIACEQLGRKCRMMEIDPRYCQVIIERWQKLTGLKAERIA